MPQETNSLIARAEAEGFILQILSRNYGYNAQNANKDRLFFIKKYEKKCIIHTVLFVPFAMLGIWFTRLINYLENLSVQSQQRDSRKQWIKKMSVLRE